MNFQFGQQVFDKKPGW